VTDEEIPIFERGDVVYGDDPFKGEEDARPWLILSNHEGRPFYGEQYIAVTSHAERQDKRDEGENERRIDILPALNSSCRT
jgi:hypothetical protein